MIKLCHSDKVADGEAIAVAVAAHTVIVARDGAQVFAYLNRCPDLKIPLEWQPGEFICPATGLLRCAAHGALFLLDTGFCVSGPCAGQALTSVKVWVDQTGEVYCHSLPPTA